MDLPRMGGHGAFGLSDWSVLRAMAAAAMPESVEGRQQKHDDDMEAHVGQWDSSWSWNNSRGTVPLGEHNGSDSTTLSMVREAQQPQFGGKYNISFNGGGGWQPWSERYGSADRPKEKEINKPKSNYKTPGNQEGRRVDHGEPWWQTREGSLQQERPGGVKDAGGSQPTNPRKKRMTLGDVTNNLSSRKWRKEAVEKLRGKMFAKSTLASKASKRKKLSEVLEKIKDGDSEFFPLTPQELELAGAVLSELQLKAGEQYINEIKLMQLEAGFRWDEIMDRQLAMIKRALRRDAGPDRRAIEVKPDEIAVEDPENNVKAEEGKPVFPKMAYVFATVWMLRSGEVTSLENRHLSLDLDRKTVSLTIPKSKMDQRAKGEKRSLSCCNLRPCLPLEDID